MKIYAAKTFALPPENVERLCGLLDSSRREKIVKIKNSKERERSIFAGLLLRYAFLQAGYDMAAWEQIEVGFELYGKPFIKGYRDFQYSLSHSGEWVVCASDTKPVGVDVQEMREWRPKLAKRFYHEDEYNRLLALAESDGDRMTKEFYGIWTAKESVAKLSGRGIGAGISRYVTSADYNSVHDTDGNQSVSIKLYDELDGYVVCACSRTGNFPEKLEEIDFDNL